MPLTAIEPINTPRLLLRPVEETDLSDLWAINGDPEVTRYLPYETWQSRKDGEVWLSRMTTLMASGTALQLVVVRKLDAKLIGTVLLFKFDEASQRIELGYVLARSAWGQGFMQEAVAAACHHAFDHLGIRRIEAEVQPSNRASCSLLTRVGFQFEGLLRKRWVAKGQAYDTNIYGWLVDDAHARQGRRVMPPGGPFIPGSTPGNTMHDPVKNDSAAAPESHGASLAAVGNPGMLGMPARQGSMPIERRAASEGAADRRTSAGRAHELRPAHTIPATQLHTALTAAFADYLIGPFDLPFDRWPLFLGRQVVDLSLSRVAMVDNAVAAFAFVSRRTCGSRWRLAAMGAIPAARGSGAAQALLDDWIERAAAADIQSLELEAFARNERALRLYRSRGFAVVHELHGYDGTIPAGPTAPKQPHGDEVERPSAFAWLEEAACLLGDVPLQATPASLLALPDPIRAWRLGTAQMILSMNAKGTVTIHSLLDLDAEQRNAELLVQGLAREYAGRRVLVPPVQRLDLGGRALQRAGLSVQPLHQVLLSAAVGSQTLLGG